MSQVKWCDHCGMDTAIRNPSGYCDHLYYPENCETCNSKHGQPTYYELQESVKRLKEENERLKTEIASDNKLIEDLDKRNLELAKESLKDRMLATAAESIAPTDDCLLISVKSLEALHSELRACGEGLKRFLRWREDIRINAIHQTAITETVESLESEIRKIISRPLLKKVLKNDQL